MIRLLSPSLDLALAQLRIWRRRPFEAFVCFGLSMAFLVIANQVYTIWLGPHVQIGLVAGREALRSTAVVELENLGAKVRSFPASMPGRAALESGEIVALVEIEETAARTIRLYFSGRNLVLDRELSGRLLRALGRAMESETSDLPFTIQPPEQSPVAITTFMTASLLSFLIFTLAHTNAGTFWVRDWEQQHLNAYLSTPAHPLALVMGRILSGMILTLGFTAAAILVCRPLVYWNLPNRLGTWFLVALVEAFLANGIFFAIAAACRRYRFYVNVSSFAVILLMFISGAVTPVEVMAPWERTLAHLTPAFYAVRSMRAVMLGLEPLRGLDIVAMLAWGFACCAIGYWKLRQGACGAAD